MLRRRDLAVLVLTTLVSIAVALAPTPAGLSETGQAALATMLFAGLLWVSGALPLWLTALLVPSWLTVLGVYGSFEDALSGFADPVIVLFLATFVFANALRVHGVDRRVALRLVAALGTSPRRLVLGVMVTTAAVSAVISNTATAAMMAPVALGLADQLRGDADPRDRPTNLDVVFLLGVAYAASVGGVATLVGTPPNAIVVAQLDARLGVRVSFVDWLTVGVPLAAVSLPLVWAVLLRVFPPRVDDANVAAAREEARRLAADAGPLGREGRVAAGTFVAVAALWLLGGLSALFEGVLPPRLFATLFGGTGHVFGPGDAQGILYYALVGLLALPVLYLSGTVDRDAVTEVDWGTLVLFGGGLSLADALATTGATRWLATTLFGSVPLVSIALVLAAVVVLTVSLSELASNTATAAIMAPLLVEVGRVYGPALGTGGTETGVLLAVGSAVAASFGFALPVATPPNAIAYGTGRVTRGQMLRVGVVLDVLMVPVTTTLLLGIFAVAVPGL